MNFQGNVERVSIRQWAQNINYDAEKMFNKIFFDDIKYLLSMTDLWTERTPPIPMKYGEFIDDTETNLTGSICERWTIRDWECVFSITLDELAKLKVDDHLVWDKDNYVVIDFVAACANIRAKIFNIPQKSRFEIKCKFNRDSSVTISN